MTLPDDTLPALDPGRSLADRVVERVARVQSLLGLLLVVGGFAAIFFGWLEASGTADVRVQMQDLISGGIGGLGMLVVGGVLLQSALADRSAARTEAALARLAAVLGPAPTDRGLHLVGDVSSDVVATHASYHRPGCDLLTARDSTALRTLPGEQARAEGLGACRVCRPDEAVA